MMGFLMTWKSAAALAAVGILATWLGVDTPLHREALPAPGRAASAATPVPLIQQQAERLRLPVPQETPYREPSRNPFRFSTRVASAPLRSPQPDVVVEGPHAVMAPPGPSVRLSGIATDAVEGALTRTAILSGPRGVQFVVVGDEFEGYRVGAIDEEAVELTSTADGTSHRLLLGQ